MGTTDSSFRTLLKQSMIYGSGQFAARGIGFLLLPVYTRFLTPASYGTLAILLVTQSLTEILMSAGMATGVLRFYILAESEDERSLVVPTAAQLVGLWSLFTGVILIGFAPALSRLFFDTDVYGPHVRLLILGAFSSALQAAPLALLRAKHQARHYVSVSLARFILGAAFNLYFLIVLKHGVLGILEGSLAGSAIATAILYVMLFQPLLVPGSARVARRLLSFSLPFVPTMMAGWTLTMADRYILKYLGTMTDLGLYSVGYKIGTVINLMVVIPFGTAWGPFMFAAAKRSDAKATYARLLTYVVLAIVGSAVVLSLFAPELMRIVTTPDYYGASRVVLLVALSYALYGCHLVATTGLNLTKKTYYFPLLSGGAALANVGMNFALIPRYGMMGAAWATLFAYAGMAVATYVLSQRYYPVEFEVKRLGKLAIVLASVYVLGSRLTQESLAPSLLLKGMVVLSIPFLLHLWRFWTSEELRAAGSLARRPFGRGVGTYDGVATGDLGGGIEGAPCGDDRGEKSESETHVRI